MNDDPRLITAGTRIAAVIGDPVRHSLSPTMHNAAFAHLGLDWVYVAFNVSTGNGARALEAMRVCGWGGASVTMPLKEEMVRACDELTPEAERVGSVNCVVPRSDAGLLGASTDGEGFIRSLREAGHDTAGRSVLILGAGGAARSVIAAMGDLGAIVRVAARKRAAAERAAALAPSGEIVSWDELSVVVPEMQMIVNATSMGMDGEMLLDPAWLQDHHVVIDLVYHPRVTPLLAAAQERGIPTVGGLGMLVHQAALAFELWTGCSAAIEVMRAAALNFSSRMVDTQGAGRH